MLILCGSSIGMMEREVLSARSPLFGRRTCQIFLRALSPFEIGKFLPNYSFKDIAIDKSYGYAIIGECKWTERKMGVEVFSELQENQLLLEMENPLDSSRYILFSRAGFTDKLVNEAVLRDDLTLVGPREFENILINKS